MLVNANPPTRPSGEGGGRGERNAKLPHRSFVLNCVSCLIRVMGHVAGGGGININPRKAPTPKRVEPQTGSPENTSSVYDVISIYIFKGEHG